jgi:hypothetical protein
MEDLILSDEKEDLFLSGNVASYSMFNIPFEILAVVRMQSLEFFISSSS